MNKILLFVIITANIFAQQDAIKFCAQSKSAQTEKLFKISKIQYPGDSNIDVTYYKLDLTINATNKSLIGDVTVKALAVKDKLQIVNLDLAKTMIVSSVTSNGNFVTFSQANDLLTINLEKEYSTGQLITLRIKYSGFPVSGNFGDFVFTTRSGISTIWSLSEPYGAKAWWPSKDTPADKADSSEVWITSDKFYTSVSNGVLIEVVDNLDGTRTYKWKNSYPIANYLISLAMTNYAQYDTPFEYEPGKFMPVTHYIFPEQLNTLKSALDLTTGMLKIFTEKFGPYPFLREKYGHAQAIGNVSMEHQTVSTMATFREDIVAHELAHQWFGDKITCKDWQNIWLNEGFAIYCESIYLEAKYGPEEFKKDVNTNMNMAKNAKGTIYVQDISSVSEIFNSNRTYAKGGIVLHMLRGIVGDEKFFQIMKTYANEPGLAYNVATTEDFQRVCERVYGKSLDYFFKEWIYGENYPKYSVKWSYKTTSSNTSDVSITLSQTANSNPSFFTMPIQIRITTDNGVINQTVFNSMAKETWVINVSGIPLSVEIDPDNWILKDIVETTPIRDDKQLPTQFSLSQNYPNPFNPETAISYQVSANSHVTLKVYDLLGKEVATLVDEMKQPGNYIVTFNSRHLEQGREISSGIYIATLKAGKFSKSIKLCLTK